MDVIKLLHDYKKDNHELKVQLHKLEKMLVINHLTNNTTKNPYFRNT